jgi:hypothetical protein
MQTTVNDIASLFMGNPGALQNRIQKEQQAKPGIPPDLKELLALQQIQEQLQAAQQQQALQNPQNQPTVAQSLQQAAKQALMARQVQAQQQQMAQAGQMGLPQGLPQPQHQPEMGLDQIQSNLGEYYGGGIVAFKEGDLVEPTAEEIEAAKKPYIGVRRPPRIAGEEPKKYEEDNLLKRFLEVLVPSKYAVDTPVSEPTKDVAPAKSEAAPPPAEAPAKLPAEKKSGIPDSPRLSPAPARPSAPLAPPVPTAEPTAAIKPTAEQDFFASRMEENPTLAAQDAANKYMRNVGPQGFNEERELIKELQARRANIGKGTNPLMDLLEGIATSAPGRGGILSQGAEGVRNARAMQQQREQQNMDMLKEILGQQKVISTGERAYKKDLFDLYQTTYKDVYKNTFDAAKAKDISDRDAAKLAQDAAENAAKRKSEEQIAKDRNENALRVANIGAASRKGDDAILNLSRADAAVTNRVRSDPVIDALQERLKKLGDIPTKENAIEAKQIMKDISDRQAKIMAEVYGQYKIIGLDGVKMPEAPGTASPGNRAPLSSFNIPQR